MKQCRRCKEEKPFEDFNARAQSPDGLDLYCRACKHEIYRTRNKASMPNPDRKKRVFNYPAYNLEQRSILMRLLTAANEGKRYPARCVDMKEVYRLVIDGLVHRNKKYDTFGLTVLGMRTVDAILCSEAGYLTPEIRRKHNNQLQEVT